MGCPLLSSCIAACTPSMRTRRAMPAAHQGRLSAHAVLACTLPCLSGFSRGAGRPSSATAAAVALTAGAQHFAAWLPAPPVPSTDRRLHPCASPAAFGLPTVALAAIYSALPIMGGSLREQRFMLVRLPPLAARASAVLPETVGWDLRARDATYKSYGWTAGRWSRRSSTPAPHCHRLRCATGWREPPADGHCRDAGGGGAAGARARHGAGGAQEHIPGGQQGKPRQAPVAGPCSAGRPAAAAPLGRP